MNLTDCLGLKTMHFDYGTTKCYVMKQCKQAKALFISVLLQFFVTLCFRMLQKCRKDVGNL